jgi:L-ascorbate metabolism protein UlaG (beta-lactamase superfamily)
MDHTIETLPWHDCRHHRTGGFQNVDEHRRPLSIWKGLTWSARRIFHGKTHRPPSVRTPDTVALRRRPARLRITWIGHTTVLVQTPDFTLLTDPIFAHRASPVPFAGPARLIPPALPVRDLPRIDAVLLSHDHYDHCDREAIEELSRRFEPTFFVPLGVARRLRDWGVEPTVEMDWWQRATFRLGEKRTEAGPLRLTCTPARHFSGRSLFDRNSTLWASWMIEAPAGASAEQSAPSTNGNGHAPSTNGHPADDPDETVRVYFGGDTGDGTHLEKIRERLGAPEVALLPIGAFQPRDLMAPIHIGPQEAMDAFEALEAEHFVPTHWGTFDLSEETVQAPAELLKEIAARRGLSGRVRIPDPGEVLSFETSAHETSSKEPAAKVTP